MSNLLNAGYMRYKKSRLTWICALCSLLIGGFTDRLTDLKEMYVLFMSIVYAVLLNMNIGREFDEGVIRNKIGAGHTRATIFLSEAILGLTASVIMFLLCSIGFAATHPEPFTTMPMEIMLKVFIGFLLLNILMAEIFIIGVFIISSKAKCIVASTLIILLTLFIGYRAQSALAEPEFLTERKFVNGEIIEVEVGENPDYPDGALRVFHKFLLYSTSFGQALEYSEKTERYYKTASDKIPEHTEEEITLFNTMTLYSLAWCIALVGGGYIAFRKKDIK